MKKLFLALGLIASLGVHANGNQQQTTDLEKIKLGCKDPAAVGNQIKPSRIQIVCKDQRLVWEQTRSGYQMIDGRRLVSTNLRTNKTNLSVSPASYEIPVAQTRMECPIMREIRQDITFNYMVTCDEVLDMGSVIDFCLEKLATDVEQNIEAMETEATGRVITACNEQRQSRRQK